MPSTTPAQQRLMGQAYAVKTGKLKPTDLDPDYRDQIVKLADSMTTKDLKDFAETKHSEMEEEEEETIYEMKNLPTYENFINESVVNEAKAIKWKPSQNPNAEGWTGKSFPHGSKGDRLLSRAEFIKKWSTRIEGWIGVKPNLDAVEELFNNHSIDFNFAGSYGQTYRIYSPGEGPRSKEYHIQKLKK